MRTLQGVHVRRNEGFTFTGIYIGKNIKYIPNIESDLLSIIKSRYDIKGSKILAKFLNNNIEIIQDVMIQGNTGNYRSVIYGLSYFEKYFYELHLKYDKSLNEDFWILRLRSLLGFILALAIEFKETHLEEAQIKGVRTSGFGTLYFKGFTLDAKTGSEEPLEEPYENKFFKNYKSNKWQYFAYTNAVDYLTGYGTLSLDSLLSDFNIAFKSDIDLPEYLKVLKKIQYGEYYKLSDSEFKMTINTIYEFLSDGKYNLNIIQDIFCKLCFFRDAINITAEDAYQKCILGLDAFLNNYSIELEESL